MATKTTPAADAAAVPAPDSTTPAPEPAEPEAPDVPADPGGVFVNTGATTLTITSAPGGAVQPGRVITLPYTPTHRDLRPATAAEITASAAADAAEAKAAADAGADTTSATE